MKEKYYLSTMNRLLVLLVLHLGVVLLPSARLLAQSHSSSKLALTLAVQCEAGTRLIFEISNTEDWVYMDMGDGLSKEYMVSDDPTYAMRVYCDAAVDNPTIKIYAKDLFVFKAPSNAITQIKVVRAPHLKELVLFENQLKEIALSSLTMLERLDLSENQLTSVDLNALSRLTFLSLEKNKLASLNLANNTNLVRLRLSGNTLKDLSLKDYTALQELKVAKNGLETLTIDNCPKLQIIDCSNNQLTDLDFKQDLNELNDLQAQYNKLSNLPFIEMPLLRSLDLSGNSFRWLDISFLPKLTNFTAVKTNASGMLNLVSNTELVQVDVSENDIETLNCVNLEKLTSLRLSHNKLKQLSISGCAKLDNLECADNLLTLVSIEGSPLLTGVDFADNNMDACALNALYEQLPNRIEEYFAGRIYVASDDTPNQENPGAATSKTTLAKSRGWNVFTTKAGLREDFQGDGSGCVEQTIPVMRLTTKAQVGAKIKLTIATADGKLEIKGLDGVWQNGAEVEYRVRANQIELKGNITKFIGQNALLTDLDISQCTDLEQLRCSWNELTTLDLSKNTKLQEVRCSWNKLMALDISHNENLQILYCSQNKIEKLALDKALTLRELYCSFNPLGAIDVHNNKALTILSVESSKLTTLDVTPLAQLIYLEASQNNLEAMDLTQTPLLTTLGIKKNRIKSLDLKANSALVYVDCSENLLSQLDLRAQTMLATLYCNDNQLMDLDLAQNRLLGELSCGNNRLTNLDLHHNEKLFSLSCYANSLEHLDLKQNSLMKTLVVGNNLLEALDLSANSALLFVDCFGNKIHGEPMTALMKSLPQRNPDEDASIYIIDGTDQTEQNVCLTSDVKWANDANWKVYDYNGDYERSTIYGGKSVPVTSVTANEVADLRVNREDLFLVVHTPKGVCEVTLYDIDGRKWGHCITDAMGIARLQVPHLAKGLYLIVVEQEVYKVVL